MFHLSAIQRDIVVVAAGLERPPGLAIRDELNEYYTKEITRDRIYRNLDILVENRLLEKTENRGRANAYLLTERGRRELTARREWLRALG